MKLFDSIKSSVLAYAHTARAVEQKLVKALPPPPPPPKVDTFTPPEVTAVHEEKKSTLYVDGISAEDVRQGEVGDCTFDASLASLAGTANGRAFLKSRITENRAPGGGVESYTVKLYEKDGAGGWKPKRVTVDASHFESEGFAHRRDQDGKTEVWPRVLEAALLKSNGGKPTTNMPDSMGVLTGKSAIDIPTETPGLDQRMMRDFKEGRVQVLSTTNKLAAESANPKLHMNHAYTVEKIQVVNGEPLVFLRNPWGYDQPRPMRMSELSKYFGDYSVGVV